MHEMAETNARVARSTPRNARWGTPMNANVGDSDDAIVDGSFAIPLEDKRRADSL
jgi:hypothetical protein